MSEVAEPSAVEGKITRERAGDHFHVVVVGAGQAGLAIGYFLGRQGRRFVILERAECDRRRLARALGFAHALHAPPLQRPAGPSLSW